MANRQKNNSLNPSKMNYTKWDLEHEWRKIENFNCITDLTLYGSNNLLKFWEKPQINATPLFRDRMPNGITSNTHLHSATSLHLDQKRMESCRETVTKTIVTKSYNRKFVKHSNPTAKWIISIHYQWFATGLCCHYSINTLCKSAKGSLYQQVCWQNPIIYCFSSTNTEL